MSDIPDLEQRLREFAVAPDEADWKDVLRRAGGRLSARRLPQRRFAFALAATLVLAASVIGVLTARETGSGSTRATGGRCLVASACGPTGPTGPTGSVGPTGPTGDIHSPVGSNPWGQYGRSVTLDELRAEAPYISLPSSELANDGNVGTVWIRDHATDPESPVGWFEAAVYYPTSGIELFWGEEPADFSDGALANGAAFPTVDGVPAFLCFHMSFDGRYTESGSCAEGPVPPVGTTGNEGPSGAEGPTAADGSNLGPALVVPFGLQNTVTLEGASVSDLIAVAQTLSPSPADVSPAGDLPTASPLNEPCRWAWDQLRTDRVSLGSVGDAADSLAFRPIAPASLGHPSAIFETNPSRVSLSDRGLSLRYVRPSKPSFWVLERPSLPTTASLLSQIGSDCHAAISTVDLGGGVTALSTRSGHFTVSRIAWVEDGVYYDVVGNATAFTEAEALSVAKAVAAAAAG